MSEQPFVVTYTIKMQCPEDVKDVPAAVEHAFASLQTLVDGSELDLQGTVVQILQHGTVNVQLETSEYDMVRKSGKE